ncbi:MAG TPA: Asd/ArgC dimerization domain-containing protein [Bryobacteraceae bacterium]|nr:Asd/ArgC dimerization domain-containing protein [Bryobacteraceae bacterium]HPT28518.1 Asd/ArgC dimerization domain-containing protein [Bryobacteraceae bacterium]
MKSQPKWVLLGADSLVGREIRELVEERKIPVLLSCCSSASDQRVLSLASEDNFDVFEELSADLLVGVCAVILAGTPKQAAQALKLARNSQPQPVFIDLTGQFDKETDTPVRAPAFEKKPPATRLANHQIVAHPAAVALATLLEALHSAHPVVRSVATVLEPASARGLAGVDELHQQTSQMFSFQTLPKKVFDVQVSFNMLPKLGDEAQLPLEPGEARIRHHLAALLNPLGIPLPSLRLVHAPVFSGYCASVWVEFGIRPSADVIQAQLASAGVECWSAEDGPLTNSSLAGQAGTLVSSIHDDPDNARASWLWLGCDNIRETALNAVALAGLAAKEA